MLYHPDQNSEHFLHNTVGVKGESEVTNQKKGAITLAVCTNWKGLPENSFQLSLPASIIC